MQSIVGPSALAGTRFRAIPGGASALAPARRRLHTGHRAHARRRRDRRDWRVRGRSGGRRACHRGDRGAEL